MSNIALPYTQIIDPAAFKSVLNAKIYIGEYGVLPNPANSATWKQAYFVQDDGSRVAASQPIRTNAAGFAVDGSGNIRTVQVDGQYSLIVQDSFGVQKYSNTRVNEYSTSEPLTVDAIDSVNAIGLPDGIVIIAKGRSAVGDGGGGIFRYSASSVQTVDGGLVFAPAAGSGRLFRDGWTIFGFNGALNIKWFGAACDAITDDTAAITSAISALPSTGGELFFPAGICVTDTITLPLYPKNISFIGSGREASLLKPKNQNQKLINSAGIVAGIGGARFSMSSMGVVPHANGSTGAAFDLRNVSNSNFKNIAFVQNGLATFDLGFELYAEDSPSTINCYYNKFEDIYVVKTSITGTLPLNQVFKLSGNTGNHVIDHLTVSGSWPTTTRPAIQIDAYCRHNIVMNSNFEGLALTGTNTVISDQGYGNYYLNNYFENTGQPYYFGAEIETGSREWAVVEKNAFAANTIDGTTTPSLVNGAIFRDSYAFGSDATVLAAIRKLQHPTWVVTLTPDSGTISLSQNVGAYSVDSNKLVTCTGQFVVGSVSAPSNNVYFNLPIAAANNTEFAFSGSVNLFGCNPISGNLILRRQSGQNIAYISYVDTNGNIQPAASLFKAGSTLEIGFSYFAS